MSDWLELKELENALLALDRTGKVVFCTECGHRKAPRGRSMPLEWHGCDKDCPGWNMPPSPDDLHPNERASDYGYSYLPLEQCKELWSIVRTIRGKRTRGRKPKGD